MATYRLALPVPPLELGVQWDGVSLLNWVLENSEPEMKQALTAMRDDIGGDKFRAVWNDKATELNRRLASRILDPRGLPADPGDGAIIVPTSNDSN